MTTPSIQPTKQSNSTLSAKRNRVVLSIFLVLFGLPVLAALWIHHSGAWQASIQTAHGELINPLAHFTVSHDAMAHLPTVITNTLAKKRWKMLYDIPEICQESCIATLYQMSQIHEATGADFQRVQRWLILSPQSDPAALEWAQRQHLEFSVLNLPENPIESVATIPDSTHYWYLADPLNTIMIRFRSPSNKNKAIIEGKGALKDIKRLLKVSKIG